jgi:hypothetical protein
VRLGASTKQVCFSGVSGQCQWAGVLLTLLGAWCLVLGGAWRLALGAWRLALGAWRLMFDGIGRTAAPAGCQCPPPNANASAFLIRSAARRNSAVLPGLKPNC